MELIDMFNKCLDLAALRARRRLDDIRAQRAGIHVTAIVPPEQGWPIAMYCPICKETTFLLSPWAIKPEKGDYWRMSGMCASEQYGNRHNMEIAVGMMTKLPPRFLSGPYDAEITQEIPIKEAKRRYPEMFQEPGE